MSCMTWTHCAGDLAVWSRRALTFSVRRSVVVAAMLSLVGTVSALAGPPPLTEAQLVDNLERQCKTAEIADDANSTKTPNSGAALQTSETAKSGQSKLTVDLADGIIWQPRTGHVRFTITGPDSEQTSEFSKLQLRVCFAWPRLENVSKPQREQYYLSGYLKPIIRGTTSATYETAFPDQLWRSKEHPAPNFGDVLNDFWNRGTGRPSHVYDGMGIVPSIDMHVVGRSVGIQDPAQDPDALDAYQRAGLSFPGVSLAITLLAIIVFWAALLLWANSRNVQGGLFLRIISNRYNYASLSQFQILVWTVVIGGGAVYVMSLSGTLISIPTQALALLGISGASALTAAVKSANDAKKGTTPPSTPPAQTAPPIPPTKAAAPRIPLVVSTGANDMFLLWLPPDGGLAPTGYTVTWTPSGNPPLQVITPFPFAQISGLAPSTAYTVTIASNNPAGGDSVTLTAVTSAANPDKPASSIINPGAELRDKDNAAILSWRSSNIPDTYIVQYQRAGSQDWSTFSDAVAASSLDGIKATGCVVGNLDCATPYQFRVAPIRSGQLGAWSPVFSLTTGTRVPHWSDLVVWDGIGELDITRVQMLVFTMVAAAFVAIKIADESAIPAIPDSIVVLMGLTNGIYVGGKYAGAGK